MSDYRIVCTKQEPCNNPANRAKIVSVGIGNDSSRYSQILTLSQVLQHMDNGHRFFTKGPRTGKIAFVESYYCNYCNQRHIRSKADSTTENNLDNLNYCG